MSSPEELRRVRVGDRVLEAVEDLVHVGIAAWLALSAGVLLLNAGRQLVEGP